LKYTIEDINIMSLDREPQCTIWFLSIKSIGNRHIGDSYDAIYLYNCKCIWSIGFKTMADIDSDDIFLFTHLWGKL
jgi:hypothetical protein